MGRSAGSFASRRRFLWVDLILLAVLAGLGALVFAAGSPRGERYALLVAVPQDEPGLLKSRA